ncbi:Competence protein F [Ketogulonicigenium robustum]|uniref:Competence protein F n=1 Tax=Ketogulonicigenium robustum TaxID=92947 RepID=A0A1W6P2Z3_9RHOB|nr:double zinc ribbon domain-containing protein [Ketogulonicigenium robustum]ARO15667.1 Competence protein F [Ketogulonicigenium robustum]
MQKAMMQLRAVVYPPTCLGCGARVQADFALCGPCWARAHFITGAACDCCGLALPGQGAGDQRLLCDDCLHAPPPWGQGVALLGYRDLAKQLVLQMKHADRTDLARGMAIWMARKAGPLVQGALLVPVPLHWTRLIRRRYNQAALLAQGVARETGADVAVDALIRPHRTRPLEGHSRAQRFAAMEGAICPHPRRGGVMQGRHVVLVDDVMTSGATFAAATQAALLAGAARVSVLALARVAKLG